MCLIFFKLIVKGSIILMWLSTRISFNLKSEKNHFSLLQPSLKCIQFAFKSKLSCRWIIISKENYTLKQIHERNLMKLSMEALTATLNWKQILLLGSVTHLKSQKQWGDILLWNRYVFSEKKIIYYTSFKELKHFIIECKQKLFV